MDNKAIFIEFLLGVLHYVAGLVLSLYERVEVIGLPPFMVVTSRTYPYQTVGLVYTFLGSMFFLVASIFLYLDIRDFKKKGGDTLCH
jgi:hypothetical protein